jgi:hypothetical protein
MLIMLSPFKWKINTTRVDFIIVEDAECLEDVAKIVRIGKRFNMIDRFGKIMLPTCMDKMTRLSNGLVIIKLDDYFNMIDPNRGKRPLVFIDWYEVINLDYMLSHGIVICTKVTGTYDIVKLPDEFGRQTKYSIIEGDVSTDRMQSIIGGIINGTSNQG